MIPKVIHYCWFGNGEKSDLAKKCIQTWKTVLPDYTIREWTEKDLPALGENKYLSQARNCKKWAFMSDVVRLYALYTEGGIYFDTDVECRKNFDEFLNADFFIGSEKSGHFESIGTGIIGAQKGNKIIKKLLDFYQTAEFIKPNGKPDLTANTVKLVPIFKSLGLKKVYTHNAIVPFDENAFLYPDTYFCVDNPDCFSVHHFEGSWGDDWELRFDLSLPLGKNKSLCLKRYKQKREKPFVYPVQTLKQLAELNCKKTRKWTLTIEKTKN